MSWKMLAGVSQRVKVDKGGEVVGGGTFQVMAACVVIEIGLAGGDEGDVRARAMAWWKRNLSYLWMLCRSSSDCVTELVVGRCWRCLTRCDEQRIWRVVYFGKPPPSGAAKEIRCALVCRRSSIHVVVLHTRPKLSSTEGSACCVGESMQM